MISWAVGQLRKSITPPHPIRTAVSAVAIQYPTTLPFILVSPWNVSAAGKPARTVAHAAPRSKLLSPGARPPRTPGRPGVDPPFQVRSSVIARDGRRVAPVREPRPVTRPHHVRRPGEHVVLAVGRAVVRLLEHPQVRVVSTRRR